MIWFELHLGSRSNKDCIEKGKKGEAAQFYHRRRRKNLSRNGSSRGKGEDGERDSHRPNSSDLSECTRLARKRSCTERVLEERRLAYLNVNAASSIA